MKVRLSPPMMSGEHWHELFLQMNGHLDWQWHGLNDQSIPLPMAIIGKNLLREGQGWTEEPWAQETTALLGSRRICVAGIEMVKCTLGICINNDLRKHTPTMMGSLDANHGAVFTQCQSNWVGRMVYSELLIRSVYAFLCGHNFI